MEERLPHAASFGYYANIVQQIELIIYTNIQPLRQKFFTKGKGQGHRSKMKVKDSWKCVVNAITWKIIIASHQFFMWSYSLVWKMTWLDFNKNGRQLVTNFFLT